MKHYIVLVAVLLAAIGCGVETSSLFPTYTPSGVYVSFTETPEPVYTDTPEPSVTPEPVDFCKEVEYTVACVAVQCAVRYAPRMEEDSTAYTVPNGTQFHVNMECVYPDNPIPLWFMLGEDNGNNFWAAGVDTVWAIY